MIECIAPIVYELHAETNFNLSIGTLHLVLIRPKQSGKRNRRIEQLQEVTVSIALTMIILSTGTSRLLTSNDPTYIDNDSFCTGIEEVKKKSWLF